MVELQLYLIRTLIQNFIWVIEFGPVNSSLVRCNIWCFCFDCSRLREFLFMNMLLSSFIYVADVSCDSDSLLSISGWGFNLIFLLYDSVCSNHTLQLYPIWSQSRSGKELIFKWLFYNHVGCPVCLRLIGVSILWFIWDNETTKDFVSFLKCRFCVFPKFHMKYLIISSFYRVWTITCSCVFRVFYGLDESTVRRSYE